MRMRAYPSFDAYLAAQSPEQQSLLRALRGFVKRTAPELVEAVKWGNGCWLQRKRPVAYVYCGPDHVQFGFINGSALKDPKGLLQGEGRYVRHAKVRRRADIDERAFASLLRQAAALGHPAERKKPRTRSKP